MGNRVALDVTHLCGRSWAWGQLLADPIAIVRPGLTVLDRGAHHLVEQVGGMQGEGNMMLGTP
jgi:hypothetical protein